MKILLPIKLRYFYMLINGEKDVELRKYCPKVKQGDEIYFYDDITTDLLGCGIIEEFWIKNPNEPSPWPKTTNIEQVQGRYSTGLLPEEIKHYFKNNQMKIITFSTITTEFSNHVEISQKLRALEQYIKMQSQKYIILEE